MGKRKQRWLYVKALVLEDLRQLLDRLPLPGGNLGWI
jgi:hypothetical protein